MIRLEGVRKIYKSKSNVNTVALDDINLLLPDTGMIMLTGKSGSGKSTLLNILGTLDTATDGKVIVDNEDILKFNNKKLNAYRNMYLGFVFQEFNLLEDLNVEENIKLAANLQRKKLNNIDISDLLTNMGLKGFESRKIFELSGGEKQRVAIARTLIKDKKIVLADEPTGNLDSQTSKYIFDTLKQLSKDYLVIVVTHDLEYAKTYGDRIIELSDGKIIKDSHFVDKTSESSCIKLKKAYLSFFSKMELAWKNLRKRKVKLLIATFFVTISLILFSYAFTLTSFDIVNTHAETLIEQEIDLITINKNFEINKSVPYYLNEEYNEVIDLLPRNSSIITENYIIEKNYIQNFEFNSPLEEVSAYYSLLNNDSKFFKYTNEMLSQLNIYGSLPVNANEVVINQLQADYLIELGATMYFEVEPSKDTSRIYQPLSYDEIVADKQKLVFGSTYIIITGIEMFDIEEFDVLKDISINKANVEYKDLYQRFIVEQKEKFNKFIVNDEFFEMTKFQKNTQTSMDIFNFKTNFREVDYYDLKLYEGITSRVPVITNSGVVTVDSLNPDEIIITEFTLSTLFSEFDIMGNYENLVLEYEEANTKRNKLIDDEFGKYENDPNYVIQEIPEIKYPNFNEEAKIYLDSFVKQYNIIGSEISVFIDDKFNIVDDSVSNDFTFKIVGVATIDSKQISNLVNYSVIENYMRENVEVYGISIIEKNKDKIIDILDEFPQSGAKYTSSTVYSDTVLKLEETVISIEKISYYVSFGFLVFTILLFSNFIVSSINSKRKDIGILRSLGATKKDIFLIFLFESSIIGIMSYVLSIIVCFISVGYANSVIASEVFIDMYPIIFNYDIFLYSALTLVIIIFFSSLLPVIKIISMRPIDIINKK